MGGSNLPLKVKGSSSFVGSTTSASVFSICLKKIKHGLIKRRKEFSLHWKKMSKKYWDKTLHMVQV